MQENFQFNPNSVKAIRWWLYLGVASLLISGIFAIPLPAARSEHINKLLPVADVFNTSLVLHVNLSILVWMFAISAVLWSLVNIRGIYFSGLGNILCWAGLAAMVGAPLLGYGDPVLSNYVPMLDNDVFIYGLLAFFAGIIIQAINYVVVSLLNWEKHTPIKWAVTTSALLCLLAFAVLNYVYDNIPNYYKAATEYYELLYWGAGHVMQFVFVQSLVAVWLILSKSKKVSSALELKTPEWIQSLIIIMPAIIIAIGSFYILQTYEIDFEQYKIQFTNLMVVANGLAPAIIGLLLLQRFFIAKERFWKNGLSASLFLSILLFLFGGIIGLKISGVNTTIPAHYHGSLGGITLGMMGFVYYIIPKVGFREPSGFLYRLQPFVYFVGQVAHVIGLYGSGGYGALRKTVELHGNTPEVSFWYGILGLGGGFAILSGLMFAIVVLRCFFSTNIMQAPRDLK